MTPSAEDRLVAPAGPGVNRRSVRSRAGVRVRRVVRGAAVQGCRATVAMRPPPDFVIVGVQRCGTTSLFRALSTHPAVFSPVLSSKGVHYFDTNYDKPFKWYVSHFPTQLTRGLASRRIGASVIAGEASPYYVFHPAAPARMAQALPAARLIVMLRDPVERAWSHYHHMRFEGHESARSFQEAIDLESHRLAGEEPRLIADPAYVSPHHQHHSYLARGQYAQQLNRLYTVYPSEHVLVLDSHRFFAAPDAGFETVLRFLGIPPSHLPASRMMRRNAETYPPIPAATVRRLREHFEEGNRQLVKLLGWVPTWCL
jgi:hypothetical protein